VGTTSYRGPDTWKHQTGLQCHGAQLGLAAFRHGGRREDTQSIPSVGCPRCHSALHAAAADPRVLEAASEASRRHPGVFRMPHARRPRRSTRPYSCMDHPPESPDWPGATSAILLLSFSPAGPTGTLLEDTRVVVRKTADHDTRTPCIAQHFPRHPV
jgi:hypothetical protein